MIYPAGLRLHAFLGNIGASDTAFSFFDDQGFAYTPVAGDRIIVDEMTITQGATSVSYTVYFDYTNAGSYAATTGEELYVGTPAVGQVVLFPHGTPRAGSINAAHAVKLRAVMGGSSVGASIMVNARRIQS